MKSWNVTSVHCLNLNDLIRNQVELNNYILKSDISKAFDLFSEDPWPVSYCGGIETEFLLPEDLVLLISLWSIFLKMQKTPTSHLQKPLLFFSRLYGTDDENVFSIYFLSWPVFRIAYFQCPIYDTTSVGNWAAVVSLRHESVWAYSLSISKITWLCNARGEPWAAMRSLDAAFNHLERKSK